jgi:RNA polymerase sigma factor (sigma-70 family)
MALPRAFTIQGRRTSFEGETRSTALAPPKVDWSVVSETYLAQSGAVQGEAVLPASAEAGLNDSALTHIFSRYGVLIVRWADRVFRDGATAEDVLHEVMLRLLRKGSSFVDLQSEAQKRAWLHRTTLRICWDMQAKTRRERDRCDSASAIEGEQRSEPYEERNLLDELCQTLDVEERILAVLFFEEGYTKMEIHELTARSRPFIDKKLGRIAAQLQQVLEHQP